jgi:hypothetical protein
MKYIIKTANLLIFVAIIANHQLQLGYFFELFFFSFIHYNYVFVGHFIDAVFCYICNAGNPACGEIPNLTVLKTEPCTGG